MIIDSLRYNDSGQYSKRLHLGPLSVALVLLAVSYELAATAQTQAEAVRMIDSLQELPMELGPLPAVKTPIDNPLSGRKIALGRRLFFDTNLSPDGTLSCASCHDPRKGFSDGRPRATGFHGKQLPRRTPSLWNSAYNVSQFWDGRAATLEAQAVFPLTSVGEMASTDRNALQARLLAQPRYAAEFNAVFGKGPTVQNITAALAAFERTLISSNSRFDRYARGDKNALTLREKDGLVLFIGKARCIRCHNGPNFTDNKFDNIGTGDKLDEGRFVVTHREEDSGSFKTPTLRNVALHAPYMHDGSASTLESVIDYYDRGGNARPGKSPFVMRIGMTEREKRDLISFLNSLTDVSAYHSAEKRGSIRPVRPPVHHISSRCVGQ